MCVYLTICELTFKQIAFGYKPKLHTNLGVYQQIDCFKRRKEVDIFFGCHLRDGEENDTHVVMLWAGVIKIV